MRLTGTPKRLELFPETDEEAGTLQALADGKAKVGWVDSKAGRVFVIELSIANERKMTAKAKAKEADGDA